MEFSWPTKPANLIDFGEKLVRNLFCETLIVELLFQDQSANQAPRKPLLGVTKILIRLSDEKHAICLHLTLVRPLNMRKTHPVGS